MKKLFSILGVTALALGMVAFTIPSASAAAVPTGTMASTAITVDMGQLKSINTITITDTNGQITAANDIRIQIPAGVNVVWDTADLTATIGGAAAAKVSGTVSYTDSKTLVLNVLTNFAAADVVTIDGLSFIGQTATSVATALEWAVDTTYAAGAASTQVTVANGVEDTLTGVDVSALDPVTGATSNYTVVFTVPATGVTPKDGKIVLTFPAGFNTAGVNATATSATMDGTLAAASSGGNLAVTITRTGTTNATAGLHSFNLTGIVNGAAGTHSVTVATQTAAAAALASGTDAAHIIITVPAAITDLTCEASGQAGAVWLRWTTPAGASIGYTAKRDLAAITNDGEFGAATAITQSWSVGTVGSSAQQLVEGLNPGTVYWFSMKSIGFGPTTSLISNATATCKAPSSASSAVHDTTGPTVQITSPASGSTVQSGQPLVIKGTAIDVGGSSVQKVEVSLDGGSTWNIATITGDDGTNVLWQYNWSLAQAGTQTIMVRGTDWVNNVTATPTTINVTVSATPGTTTPTYTAPTTPTITVPAGLTGIQAQIYTLQVQLVSLLQQFLTMLLAAR